LGGSPKHFFEQEITKKIKASLSIRQQVIVTLRFFVSFCFVSSLIRVIRAIRGSKSAAIFRITSRWFPFCTSMNGQK